MTQIKNAVGTAIAAGKKPAPAPKKSMAQSNQANYAGVRARMAKMKEDLSKRASKKDGGGDFDKITIEDGEKKIIRIGEPWTGDPNDPFYAEMQMHFNLGPDADKVAICPGKDVCPACQKVWNDREALIAKHIKLAKGDKKKGKKDAMNSAEWRAIGSIGAKTRYVMNAIEIKATKVGNGYKFSAESDTYKLWYVGPQIFKQITDYFMEEMEWGIFYDPDRLYDFKVERTGSELQTNYVAMPTRQAVQSVDTSGAQSSLRDLSPLVVPNTPEEVQQIMDGVDPEEEPAAEPTEEPSDESTEEGTEEGAEEEVNEEELVEEEPAVPPKALSCGCAFDVNTLKTVKACGKKEHPKGRTVVLAAPAKPAAPVKAAPAKTTATGTTVAKLRMAAKK